MPKATNTPTTSRRGLLAGSGAGAILAGIGVPAIPLAASAEPLPAYREFWEAHGLLSRWDRREISLSDAQADEFGSRWHDALSAIADHPAGTLAELRDKAKVMVAAFEFDVPSAIGDVVEDNAQPHEWVGWRMVHDFLAWSAGA